MRPDEGLDWQLDFSKLHQIARDGYQVVPVVIQHIGSGEVLMLGYMNQDALQHTMTLKEVVLFSTSRGSIWHKGLESGNRIKVASIWVNCEQNSLLIKGIPLQKGVCHTKNSIGEYRTSCYFRELVEWPPILTNGESPPSGVNQDNSSEY